MNDRCIAAGLIAGGILNTSPAISGHSRDTRDGYQRIRLIRNDVASPTLRTEEKIAYNVGAPQMLLVNRDIAGADRYVLEIQVAERRWRHAEQGTKCVGVVHVHPDVCGVLF